VEGSAMYQKWYFEVTMDHIEQTTHMMPHLRIGWANTTGYISNSSQNNFFVIQTNNFVTVDMYLTPVVARNGVAMVLVMIFILLALMGHTYGLVAVKHQWWIQCQKNRL